MLDKNGPDCNYEIMTLLRFFRGRIGFYGKCMNRRSGLTQNPMDEPVPLDTPNPLKRE